MPDTDVIVIGAGLAGLVAATEAVAAGKRVVVIDQESRENLGGQGGARAGRSVPVGCGAWT